MKTKHGYSAGTMIAEVERTIIERKRALGASRDPEALREIDVMRAVAAELHKRARPEVFDEVFGDLFRFVEHVHQRTGNGEARALLARALPFCILGVH